MMMMIDVLRPLLCTWQIKKAERFAKVMNRSQRVNSLRYAYAKIRIRVVVICGPAQYQLDHGGAPSSFHKTDKASFQLVHNLINLFAINECPYLQHIIILLFHFYKEKN